MSHQLRFTALWALLLCLTTQWGVGQTLHFIVFADTDDPTIGQAGLKTHTYLAQDLAPAMAKQTGMNLAFSEYIGQRCRASELDALLTKLTPGPTDVVFFYFTGHGWNNRQNEYPSLILGNANTDRVSLETSSRNLLDVYERLRAKNARLTIAIGEACNKERSDAPPRPSSSRAPDYMKTTTYSPERFGRLFREYQGGLLMASSQRGQLSVCDPKGGLLSIALQNTLRRMLADDQKGPIAWEPVLQAVVTETEAAAQQAGQQQNPFFKTDLRLSVASKPAPMRPADPVVASASPCASVDAYVNETALAGIREDLPLLRDMNERVNSNNAESYARAFLTFYSNQKKFYDNLGQMVFYESSTMPERCRPEFQQNISWIRESTDEINERYQLIQKFAQKPLQLAAQARSELPSLITRLEEILEELDK
ncbi:MAG: hypothetical protein EAZ91_25335 [Cytophagales bacterium]|nr:MAG: hypothetical protein EAZ91_25335 [Cytophagales bacterium]